MRLHRLSRLPFLVVLLAMPTHAVRAEDAPPTVELPADVLEDKLRGGLLGQIFGNLNGLEHEFKYIREPGKVERYVPALPDGARTDDDTDIEWVYVVEMQRARTLKLPPERITALWKAHVNRQIWCANDYARQLMELGIHPPQTGRAALNPWSTFNIGGSFLAETFALAAPGMPRTAADLALHYTHVGIDDEPAQATQFVAAMIATAYVETDVERILDAGLAAVDERSGLRRVIGDVRKWHRAHPDDWRATRKLVRDAYTRYGSGETMPDKNGCELNIATTAAALLYGRGDFAETLRIAFNFGWDCDNSAAAVATVVGVIKGRRWMDAQGWNVKDVYANTSRDAMPGDETITRFGDRVIDVMRLAVRENGGDYVDSGGKRVYRIRLQQPAVVEKLPHPPSARHDQLTELYGPRLAADLASESPTDRARAAYLAICLRQSDRLAEQHPEAWGRAIASLQERTGLIKALFESTPPLGPDLQKRALAAGLKKAR